LNEHLFATLGEADRIIEEWRIDYNTVRPHGRLGKLPPAVYGATRSGPDTQRGGSLRSSGGYAPRPVASASASSYPEQTQPTGV
jgi:putative transposase